MAPLSCSLARCCGVGGALPLPPSPSSSLPLPSFPAGQWCRLVLGCMALADFRRSCHHTAASPPSAIGRSLAGFATVSGMSALVLQHLRYVRHHVFKGGDVSQRCASYPVLLFSHGLGGSPDCYRALIQEHVSQVCCGASWVHVYAYGRAPGLCCVAIGVVRRCAVVVCAVVRVVHVVHGHLTPATARDLMCVHRGLLWWHRSITTAPQRSRGCKQDTPPSTGH